jgi:ATP/maltotriose-dependent transcriptional regulator MalT
MTGCKRIGILLLGLLFLSLPLVGQESSGSKLTVLEDILMKLEVELLNSKQLLEMQAIELENSKNSLETSEKTIASFTRTIASSKNNIAILEATISSLKAEILALQNQTKEASVSLERASESFEKYKKTNSLLWGIAGVALVGLAGSLTYALLQ